MCDMAGHKNTTGSSTTPVPAAPPTGHILYKYCGLLVVMVLLLLSHLSNKNLRLQQRHAAAVAASAVTAVAAGAAAGAWNPLTYV